MKDLKIRTIFEKIIRAEIKRKFIQEAAKNIEYVIWGIPPGKTNEELLITKLEGEYVTDLKIAERVKDILEKKHGCKNVRIQAVNLSDYDISDFRKTF